MTDSGKKIGSFGVHRHGLLKAVERVVGDWNPGTFANEKEYRDSLYTCIRDSVPKAYVEREYRHLGTTTDIYVRHSWWVISQTEVFVELKLDLQGKGEFDRLLGQITEINPRKRQVLVVLCGDTKTEWYDRLREIHKDLIYDEVYDNATFAVVLKPHQGNS